MEKQKKFNTIIHAHEGGGAYIIIPFDVEKAFGKKRVKVKAWFDGVLYQGSLVRMGTPDHILIIRKDIRQKIGKDPGDFVDVELIEDK